MGPIWGRQDQGGAHMGHVNLAIWVGIQLGYIDMVLVGGTDIFVPVFATMAPCLLQSNICLNMTLLSTNTGLKIQVMQVI